MISIKYPYTVIIYLDWGAPPYKVYVNNDLVAENVPGPVYELNDLKVTTFPFSYTQFTVEDSTGQTRNANYYLNSRISGQIKEILRREHIWEKQFSGMRAILLKRRRFGIRCPVCYDKEFNSAANSKCKICFGTKYVNGYNYPVFARLVYSPPSLIDQPNIHAPLQLKAQNFVVSPDIKLDVNDLIYVPDYKGKIYRVTGVNLEEYQGILLKQDVTAVELNAEAIEYLLVNDLQNINEFDNLSIQNDYEAYLDLLLLNNYKINSIKTGFLSLIQVNFKDESLIDLQNSVNITYKYREVTLQGDGSKLVTNDILFSSNLLYGFLISFAPSLKRSNVYYSVDSGNTWNLYKDGDVVQFTGNSIKVKIEAEIVETINGFNLLYK